MRAAGCRKARSRLERICAMVTPAPISIRAPAGRICEATASVERTMVVIDTSPSLIARMTSVPPPRKRAPRSEASAEVASPSFSNVLTVMGTLVLPSSCGEIRMPADRFEAGHIDVFAHHPRHRLGLASARREPALPAPERAIAIGDRHQAYMRHIIEERNRRIQQAIGKRLFQVRERQQLLAQYRAVLENKPPHAADLVGLIMPLDHALVHRRMPAIVTVEIADQRPHPVDRRIDDR